MTLITPDARLSRRSMLAAGGLGLAGVLARPAGAAQPTAEEAANVEVVNALCAAFTAPLDLPRITGHLTADCKYRATQTAPMVEGPAAIEAFLDGIAGSASAIEFEVVDTWARGPVVVDDRIDRFTFPDQQLDIPVVGVFHLIDGKIAEWTDFVFGIEL